MIHSPRARCAILCLLVASLGCSAPQTETPDNTAHHDAAKWTIRSEDWYALTLAGAPAGQLRVVRDDDGQRYRTTNEMSLKFQQAGANLNVRTVVEWIETHKGEPVRLTVIAPSNEVQGDQNATTLPEQDAAKEGEVKATKNSKRAWQFDGKSASKLVEGNDGTVSRVRDAVLDKPWLTPAAAERFIREQISKNSETLEYGSLQPGDTLGHVVVRSSFVGPTEFPFDGALIPARAWRTQAAADSAQTLSYYALDGKLLYSATNFGFGLLETRLCTKAQSTEPQGEQFTTVGGNGFELNEPIIAKSRAVYEVRPKHGEMPAIPGAGSQSVEVAGEGGIARITVDINRSSAATAVELAEAAMHEGSPAITSIQEEAQRLAAQAMRETKGLGPRALADASHAVVYRRLTGNSSGTNPGHSMGWKQAQMLAEVLRTHRITSRMVLGLAHQLNSENKAILRWRVWTQAMMDETWIDFDPSSQDRFTAGHILIVVGPVGSDGAGINWAALARRFGDVDIKVIAQE